MDSESHQPQAESSTSGDLMDTTSLRAAALLSRKRRKVAMESLPRPALEASFQLDYGQEDSTPASSHPPSTDTKPPPLQLQPGRSGASMVNQTSDMEPGQREEGEISDNETSPAPQSHRRTPTPPARISPRMPTTQQQHHTDRGKNDTGSFPPSLLCESDAASPSEATHHLRTAGFRPCNESYLPEPPAYRLDASHVRPGLTSSCWSCSLQTVTNLF